MTVATSQTWNPTQYSKNARFVSDLGMPVIELLAPRAGEHILDLGCGDGPLTKKLADLGCQVVGVDSSQEMITAALSLGLDACVMDGHSLQYEREFDAVFTNAALHWMKQPEKVIAGVWKSLKPGGRFVGEFGGYGNVATIVAALESGLVKRGIDANAFNPWYFPDIEEYKSLLKARGFTVNTIVLVPRPTPLPGDLVGWLETFAKSYTAALPASEHIQFLEEAAGLCRTKLSNADGKWTADYVRLRFYATKPTESIVLRQRSFICQNSNHEKNLLIKTDSRAKSLLQGRLHDPLSYLGPHHEKDSHVVRVFQPYASEITLVTEHGSEPLQRVHTDGLFEWHGSDEPPHPYQLRILEDGEERLAACRTYHSKKST